MSGGRLFAGAFASLAVSGLILAMQGRSLSITTGMLLVSCAFSVAAIVLGALAIKRR